MKLIRADYIIGVALLLMLGTHAITNYLVAKHTTTEITQKKVEAWLELSEANPLAAWFLKFEKMRIIYSVVIAPALMFGIYYYYRRKYAERDVIYVESVAIMTSMMFLINFFNDASHLMGFLLR